MVMALSIVLPARRTAWLLLASAIAARGQHLYQTYCSNENTGADYQGGRDESIRMFTEIKANIEPVNDIYNSNGACKTQCQGEYAFAIVQWQNCWCSNYIPAEQNDVGTCNQQCPGYPNESCGNEDDAMYGYIQLSRAPSGTLGSSSSVAQQTSTSYSSPSETSSSAPPPSTSAPPPPPSSSSAPPPTETSIVSQTVVSTVTEEHTQRPDTVVSTVTPTLLPLASTSFTLDTSTAAAPSTSSLPPPPSTSSTSSPDPPSSQSGSPTPVVSTRVLTISGQQVTQTVTSTPFYNPGSDEQDQQVSRSGLSGGAIAGIVIGTLIGLAALLLAAFLLWRRKKQQDTENGAGGNGRPKRTTSVLSKTGLLSRGTGAARPTSMAENNFDEGGYSSVRHSMLFGAGAGATVEPSSPLGGSQSNVSSTRRHSRPLVYDQRLNPSALFANAEANGSRVSMQDTQDYSRPLGIANPDTRASFDSRFSGR